MKYFIVIFVSAVLLNYVSGVKYEYDEEDVYDDFDVNAREEPMDEEYEKPNYDIKDAPNLFKKFVNDYNKQYKTEQDYKIHYANFVKNLEAIIALNKEGRESIEDINMFADLGEDELAKLSG